jgi:phosphate transport system substrate-binding protein
VKLPADDITVVHRADSSGTSFLFTDYLSKTNPEFKTKIGAGTAVKWATGVGGKGNEGVAANVQRIKGSIGYVEWAYAKKNKMAHTQLKNRDGAVPAAGRRQLQGRRRQRRLGQDPGLRAWC